MGIACGASVDTTQRHTKQCVKAVHTRRLALMQQGKVSARMRLLMRRYRVGELGYNRAKSLVVVAPMGNQRHADTQQTGPHLDEMPLRRRLFFESSLGAVALCLD